MTTGLVSAALLGEVRLAAERQLRDALRGEVRVLHRLLADLPEGWTPADALAQVAEGTRRAVLLLDARGRAVAWRATDPRLEAAVLRGDVARALAAAAGEAPAVRAYPAHSGGEAAAADGPGVVAAVMMGPEGYRDLRLVVAASDAPLVQAREDARRRALGAGFVLVLLAGAAGGWAGMRLRRQARRLRAHLSGMPDGAGSAVPELSELAEAAARVGEGASVDLAAMRRALEGMQVLIDALDEGVVELDAAARIVRANRAARRLLGLPEEVASAPVGAAVRHPELRAYLEAAAVERAPGPREVALADHTLRVSARPLPAGGAVVTLLDVSEVRRAEQVRRDFVANASHELKTPLTSIRGYAETLLDDAPPAEIARTFLTAIRNNALRLQRLVEDLLDLSRLESGRWAAQRQPVVVGDVAREAWALVRPSAEEKGVAVEVDADVEAEADRDGLVHVFVNLFENAIRHVDEGGHVWVRARPDGDRAVVEVADDGEGIPSRALPRIFERFYRADRARDRDAGGTGLGLSIVRHMVNAMGGEVSAESELGRGTTIRFTLPR